MNKLLIIFFLFPLVITAQITENFTDGNFTSDPVWSGDDTEFRVNSNYQLQTDGVSADTSILTLQAYFNGSTEWDIWVRLSFSPSDNNNLRIYLMSDCSNLKSPLNGYYIKIGENGSDDSIDLYKQTGLSSEKLIDGIPGNVAFSTNILNLKIIRNEQNYWEVFSDINSSGSYSMEGSCIDSSFLSAAYFGFYCNYTSSNSTKFYFDDIYIGDIIVDTIPPQIISSVIGDDNIIGLSFSEGMNNVQVLQQANYFIPQINLHPAQIVILSPSEINIDFSFTFQSGINYSLEVSGISDMSDNFINDTIIEISYFELSQNKIIINELMADPFPVVDLPEVEYIELYNASGRSLLVTDLFLKAGESVKEIPEFTFPSDSFVVLCSSLSANDFQNGIHVVGITGFPSLTNAGQEISLIYNGQIINQVSYSDKWYKDPIKQNGGWSLEKIDPRNNCSKMSNWMASTCISGGTPGEKNSVFSANVDNIPPQVSTVRMLDSLTLSVEFSEEIMTFGNLDNFVFTLDQSGLHPEMILTEDNISFQLIFNNIFLSGNEYKLNISSLADLCGNLSADTSILFTYYKAKMFDIIINEIMYDPSPVVELPESDYLEIYNRSDFEIDLNGWMILIGEKEIYFPSDVIYSGEFVVLCPEGNQLLFGSFVHTIGILGSNDLTNEGKAIAIVDMNGKYISGIEYNSALQSSSYKSDGGWSLERIDFDNVCEINNNWVSSINPAGGTPGWSNSVYNTNIDNVSPVSKRVEYIDPYSIRLLFSEQMDILNLGDINNYHSSGNLGYPETAIPDEFQYRSVTLEFSSPIEPNIIYSLSINNTCDCEGNYIIESIEYFGVPFKAESKDIVINEVLFNPLDDGVDYIEVYNRSNKIVDLSDILLAAISDNSSDFESIREISESSYLFFPGEYLVVTSSTSKVLSQYYYSDPDAFLNPDIQIPPMSNTSGRIVVISRSESVIDDFSYNEEMHHSLLNSFEGVSLERINFNYETNDPDNWHSAAESFGFGTPGIINSQFSDFILSGADLTISPEIFSPDNDGNDDFLSISYSFDKPGNVGTMAIFDSKGRKVKILLNNTLLATDEIIRWDGTDENKQRCRVGIYIILFEFYKPDGSSGKTRKAFVLANKYS